MKVTIEDLDRKENKTYDGVVRMHFAKNGEAKMYQIPVSYLEKMLEEWIERTTKPIKGTFIRVQTTDSNEKVP